MSGLANPWRDACRIASKLDQQDTVGEKWSFSDIVQFVVVEAHNECQVDRVEAVADAMYLTEASELADASLVFAILGAYSLAVPQ